MVAKKVSKNRSRCRIPKIVTEEGDGVEVWLIATVSNGMQCKEMIGSRRYENGAFFH